MDNFFWTYGNGLHDSKVGSDRYQSELWENFSREALLYPTKKKSRNHKLKLGFTLIQLAVSKKRFVVLF